MQEQQIPKYIKLFENGKTINSLQHLKVAVTDTTLNPSKEYIISKIQGIVRYYSGNPELQIKLKSHDDKEVSIEKLVDTTETQKITLIRAIIIIQIAHLKLLRYRLQLILPILYQQLTLIMA